MLNRIEVTDPPNSAPQYMLESRMMAETGCMPKVNGSSNDTPFGAPSPGSTPTRMPSSTPTTISARCGTVTAMVKPCRSSPRLSIGLSSEAKRGGERAMRQAHLEHALEHDIERERSRCRHRERPKQRLMPGERQHGEDIEGRGEIHPEQRDRGHEDRGRYEQAGEPAQLDRRDSDGNAGERRSRHDTAHQIVEAPKHDHETDHERERAGIHARARPADAIVQARDHHCDAKAAGEDSGREFEGAARYHQEPQPGAR